MCWSLVQLDQYAAVEELFQNWVEQEQMTGIEEAQVYILGSLGTAALRQGNHEQALNSFQQALEIATNNGLKRAAITSLIDIGNIEHNIGDDTASRSYYERSLDLAREIGVRTLEGVVLTNLAVLSTQQGLLAQGRRDYLQVLIFLARRAIGRPRALRCSILVS